MMRIRIIKNKQQNILCIVSEILENILLLMQDGWIKWGWDPDAIKLRTPQKIYEDQTESATPTDKQMGDKMS